MRILVTGSRGKVGSATVDALHQAGHEVTACDLGAARVRAAGQAPPLRPGRPHRRRRRVRSRPRPRRRHPRRRAPGADPQPAAHVFQNNLMSVFNTLEAAVPLRRPALRQRVERDRPRLLLPRAPFLPDYAPVDEEHPIRPQDPYATAKYFSELLMDAAMRRSDIRCLTIRPSWVQWEGNYGHDLGPGTARPRGGPPAPRCGPTSTSTTSPTRCDSPPSPTSTPTRSSTSPPRQPRQPAARRARPPPPRRRDRAARAPPPPRRPGLSIAKAERLLGYAPSRSWRDYLTRGRRAARGRPRAARARVTPAFSAGARWAERRR